MTIDPFIAGICAAIVAATPITIAFVNAIGKTPEHKAKLLRLIGVQMVYGLVVFIGGFAVSARITSNSAVKNEPAQGEQGRLAPPPWSTPAALFSVEGLTPTDFAGQRVEWTLEFESVGKQPGLALFHYSRPRTTPVKVYVAVDDDGGAKLNTRPSGTRYIVTGTIKTIEPNEYVQLDDTNIKLQQR